MRPVEMLMVASKSAALEIKRRLYAMHRNNFFTYCFCFAFNFSFHDSHLKQTYKFGQGEWLML